jgi:GNAT superfamily N-acetyltransferase
MLISRISDSYRHARQTLRALAGGVIRGLRRIVRRVPMVRWLCDLPYEQHPSWWPVALSGRRRSPHEGRSVVIFAEGRRFEFVPAVLGPYSGHVFASPHPDVTDIARRLARASQPVTSARALAVVSSFEGGYDSIQTYDRAGFSWGFIQFAATGGLPRLLGNLKTLAPDVFAELFVASGVDVVRGHIVITLNGRVLTGRAARNRLHDDPALWTPFLKAASRSRVKDIQVLDAYRFYYEHPLKAVVMVDSREMTLATLLADSELARAVVCDRAVNRGVGHASALFRQAVQLCRARGPADVDAVLACVRDMEAADGARLDALVAQMTGHH